MHRSVRAALTRSSKMTMPIANTASEPRISLNPEQPLSSMKTSIEPV
jgi:hypothetical protein